MYDIVYIGGGLNYAGAIVAAKHGKKVALIEKDLSQLGGVCLHKGCIPSKLFLHHAKTVYESKNTIFEGTLYVNQKKLYETKEHILNQATKKILKQCSGFDLIEADAKIIAPHKIEAGEKIIEAAKIVIGTGSSPFIPTEIIYDGENIITSDDVLQLTSLPQNIAIYGTGTIGLEMATFFAMNGVDVTLINRHNNLLKQAHNDIDSALIKQLQELGITILQEHSIKTARAIKDHVEITFEDNTTQSYEKLLVATGRKPNTDVIQTNEIRIEKGIVTDEYFETSLKDHYAIGDVNAKVQLAHAARAQTLHVTSTILGKNQPALNLDHIVKFIHTLPMSYASVGEIKSSLQKQNTPYKESIVPLNRFTYSMYNYATDGLMITYADETGRILGAEILAPYAEEIISTVAMTLAGEIDTNKAKRTILAHPTFSEALEKTFYKL